jgi:hypothetical protein
MHEFDYRLFRNETPNKCQTVERSYLSKNLWICTVQAKYKGKAIPLQLWTGPEDSRRLRFPDFIGT